MNRYVRVYLGWPTQLLGPLTCDSSSKNENYAVLLFEDETTEHAFLVFEPAKIGEIVKAWMMGETGDHISERIIHS